jgi:hypothetical protein
MVVACTNYAGIESPHTTGPIIVTVFPRFYKGLEYFRISLEFASKIEGTFSGIVLDG